MANTRLIVITGIMAAGKSTVAQALAERFPTSAHVRGDQFRRAIVAGRHEMAPSPTAEALDQLRLRYRLAISAAETYQRAGFTTIVQDTIIGPMLEEFVSMVVSRPFSLVVLAPHPDQVDLRERQRPKTGYRTFTPHELDAVLRNDTPKLGYWLDSTHLTVDQTVDDILANLDGEARLS